MQILKGHLYGKPVQSLEFSPDGSRLVSTGIDGKTILWEPATGRRRSIDEDYACHAAFSPDGKVVALGRYRGLKLWDIGAAEARLIPWAEAGFGGEFAFEAASRTLITVARGIRIWDIDSGNRLSCPGFDRSEVGSGNGCLALTSDRRTMATGHRRPHVVRLWDVESQSVRGEITGPTALISRLAFSPDGKSLAAACGTTLWVWEVASKRVLVEHRIDRLYFKDVAFTPDGRFLVFARNDATVNLWDTTSWTQSAAYDFGIGPMVSVACAPDGMRAAGGSAKGTIVVFDIDV